MFVMLYSKNMSNPVFLVTMVDQYGNPVTGVTAPTVYLSKSQAADAVKVQLVESTDFTWHELTDGEKFKGVYKLRQVNAPNVNAVDTEGACALSVYKTDHDTAAGGAIYYVSVPVTPNVTLGAIQATRVPGNRTSSPVILEMWQHEATPFAITCQDANGNPVDLSARTLRFVVQDSGDPPTGKFEIEGESIGISGDGNEVATVAVASSQSATASLDYYWLLRDVINETVLSHGPFRIRAGVADV